MSKFSTWFSTNKVLLLGLLGAVLVVLQQFLTQSTVDYKVVGFGVAIAILSFLAKNLRGQVASILGLLGSSVGTIAATIETGGKVTWIQVVISLIVAILGVVAPPAKSLSYETSSGVVAEKAEAAKMDASKQPPVTPPVQTNP